MIQKRSHVAIGIAFVCVCTAAGAVLFALTDDRPAKVEAPALGSSNAIDFTQESEGDMEAGTEPKPEHASDLEVSAGPHAPATDADDGVPAKFAAMGLKTQMPYGRVKQILSLSGFEPVQAHDPNEACSSIGAENCEAHPEIESCSGTGLGYCNSLFEMSDTIATVTTYGPGGPLAGIEEAFKTGEAE